MRFRVILDGVITDDEGVLLSPEALDALLDQVVMELYKLPEGKDADVGATLTKGLIQVAVTWDTISAAIGEATTEAVINGGAVIRCALHAAQIATPGWSWEQLRVAIESEPVEAEGPILDPTKELVDV